MNFLRRKHLDSDAFPVPGTRSRTRTAALWAAAVTTVFLLQTNIGFLGFTLNLSVLIPFYVGLRRSPERGMAAGVGIGLLEDSLASSIVGPNILSKGLIGLVAPLMSGKLFIWTPAFGVAALFGMTVADGLLAHLSRVVFEVPHPTFRSALGHILLQALVNAPFGYFIRPRD